MEKEREKAPISLLFHLLFSLALINPSSRKSERKKRKRRWRREEESDGEGKGKGGGERRREQGMGSWRGRGGTQADKHGGKSAERGNSRRREAKIWPSRTANALIREGNSEESWEYEVRNQVKAEERRRIDQKVVWIRVRR